MRSLLRRERNEESGAEKEVQHEREVGHGREMENYNTVSGSAEN